MFRIDTSMESGGIGMFQFVEPDTIRMLPYRDYNHEGRNWTGQWFYIRIIGAKGRTLRLEFVDLIDEWKYGASFSWGANTRPVYSNDGGKTWSRTARSTYLAERRTLIVEHAFESDAVSFAYIEPYPVSRAEALVRELAAKPGVRIASLGKSVEGRDLPKLTIGSGARRAWIMARQHPWETGTSFAAEGLLRFLVSGDADAARILSDVTFVVTPMLNPDGVARAGTRYNARGYDPMRDLDKASPEGSLETYQLLRDMRYAKANGEGAELILNLHNNNQEARDIVGGYYLDARDPRLWSFGHSLARHTFFRGQVEPWPYPESSIPADCGCGMLLELKSGYIPALRRYVTAEDQMSYGRGLAYAVADHFSLLAGLEPAGVESAPPAPVAATPPR